MGYLEAYSQRNRMVEDWTKIMEHGEYRGGGGI